MGRQRGLTLVEICITVAILAMAAAVVIPGMNNLSRANLRKAASAMSATVRQSYDDAALGGKTVRLVFTPGKSKITIESSEESLSFDDKSGAFVAAAQQADQLAALQAFPGSEPEEEPKGRGKGKAKADAHAAKGGPKDDDSAGAPGALGALFGINKLADKGMAAGFQKGGVFELGDGVSVLDVWTDGMEQAAVEGDIYLYFFPSGYTQQALIHLQDTDKRVFTVKVSPLTGKSEILDNYVEVPK